MKPGIYKHRKHPELKYLFMGLAHHHDNVNDDVAVYTPLFTRPDWAGRSIMTYRSLASFNETFEWVGERLE